MNDDVRNARRRRDAAYLALAKVKEEYAPVRMRFEECEQEWLDADDKLRDLIEDERIKGGE